MKSNRLLFVLFILVNLNGLVSAQLSVDINATATKLAQTLVGGKNITISNASLNCNPNARGLFTSLPNVGLGLDSGILLTTGNAATKPSCTTPCCIATNCTRFGVNGPQSEYASFQYSFTPIIDPPLQALANVPIFDRCQLQFDFVPKGDTIRFNYVFSSDQYYLGYNVCDAYTDAFGIFISGAGIVGTKNIATIPGTSIPININTICAGIDPTSDSIICLAFGPNCPYTQYFISNANSPYLTHEGMTTVLTATHAVVPNTTYNIRFAIADGIDPDLDAAVFIGAASLVSNNPISVDILSSGGISTTPSYAMEGCGSAQLRFRVTKKVSVATPILLGYGGSTQVGLDYNSLPNMISIPLNDSLVDLPIAALLDSLSELQDSLLIYYSYQGNTDTISLQFRDRASGIKVFNQSNDTTVCESQTLIFSNTFPSQVAYTVLWTPNTFLSSDTAKSPICIIPKTSLDSIRYTLHISHPSCPTVDSSLFVSIQHPPLLNWGNDTFLCQGDTMVLPLTINAKTSYTHSYAPLSSLSQTQTLSPRAYPTTITSYIARAITTAGCEGTDTLKVAVIDLKKALDSILITPSNCFQNTGKISVYCKTSPTPIFYSLNNQVFQSSSQFTGLKDTTYRITLGYQNKCRMDTSVAVSLRKIAIMLHDTSGTCGQKNGRIGTFVYDGIPPYSYLWSHGKQTPYINQLDSGLYKVTVTDAEGCTVIDSITLKQEPSLKVLLQKEDAFCGHLTGSAYVKITQGTAPYTYQWRHGSNKDSLINLSMGIYYITVTDAKGCRYEDSVSILYSTSPQVSFQSLPASCQENNGSLKAIVMGGQAPFQYLWTTGQTQDSLYHLKGNQTYTLMVTDKNGCSDTSSIFLDSIPKFSATVSIDTPYCGLSNGKMTVQVVGGIGQLNYRWNGQIGNATKNNIDSGKMTLILSDQKCTDTFAYQVTYKNKALKAIKEIVEDKICYSIQSGRIEIGLEGGLPPYSYQWSHGANSATIANLMEGTYGLVARDQQGCVYSNTYKIATPNKIEIQDTLYHVSCYGRSDGKIKLGIVNGIEPYRYLWSNNEKTRNLSNLSSGTYKVTVENNIVCLDSFAFVIKTPAPIQFRQLQLNPPTCNNGWDGSIEALAVGGVSKMSYKLNEKPVLKKQKWMNLNAATYKITAFDSSGCEIDTFVQLVNPPKNEIIIYPKDTSIVMGSSVQMHYYATNRLLTKEWTPEMYFNCSNCDSPILSTYKDIEITLKGIDERQCEAYAKTHVYVWDSSVVFIPDAFTPTKSTNERFKVYGRSIKVAQIQIYNRWGEKVFESDKALEEGWDGQFKNESAPSGTYIYTVTCIALNNKIFKHQGNFVLIR